MQQQQVETDANANLDSTIIAEKIRAVKAAKCEQKSVMNQERKVLGILFLTLVLDLLAFTCILPLFPAILDYYSTKTERVGSLLSYILWSRALTFSIFVLSRVVGGASKASVSVATAVVADACGPAHRGKGMAVIGVSFSVGFVVGPMIGAFFASKARTTGLVADAYYFSTPAYFAICLTLLELLCIWFLMPETLKKENRQNCVTDVAKRVLDYVNPKCLFRFSPVEQSLNSQSLKSLQDTGFVYFLYLFIYSGLEFTLTFFTHLRFNYDSMQQGRMYLFAGLLMALVQGGYVRKIPAGNQRKAAQWGLGFIIPAYVIVGLATNTFLLYIGLSLYALASGIVVPCITAYVSSYGSETEKGTIMGIFRSLGALARAFGPLIASAVFWCLGPVACYVTGGLLLSIPYLLLRKMGRLPRTD